MVVDSDLRGRPLLGPDRLPRHPGVGPGAGDEVVITSGGPDGAVEIACHGRLGRRQASIRDGHYRLAAISRSSARK